MSKNSKQKNQKNKAAVQSSSKPSTWMIVALVAIAFAIILVVKTTYYPSGGSSTNKATTAGETRKNSGAAYEASLNTEAILAVASQFRCACGGCGELPLDECHCDMPRGAFEEKTFIKERLDRGMSPNDVADLLEIKYGHREKG